MTNVPVMNVGVRVLGPVVQELEDYEAGCGPWPLQVPLQARRWERQGVVKGGAASKGSLEGSLVYCLQLTIFWSVFPDLLVSVP